MISYLFYVNKRMHANLQIYLRIFLKIGIVFMQIDAISYLMISYMALIDSIYLGREIAF